MNYIVTITLFFFIKKVLNYDILLQSQRHEELKYSKFISGKAGLVKIISMCTSVKE